MIQRDKNMTLDDLRKLPRISRGKGTSLLGVWIQANEDGDTEMVDLAMSVMVEQDKDTVMTPNRGPMIETVPGRTRQLLRRIDMMERIK
jgi:hypothetical protein